MDSAVITLTLRDTPAVPMSDEALFIRVVKECFSQRRKTLRNALRRLGLPADAIADVGRRTGIDLVRRPETLSVADFANLTNALPR